MRVLQIAGGLPSKDKPFFQTFIKSQIDSLIKEGIDIEIYDVKGYESSLNYLKAINNIKKLVKEKEIDLIHAHYSYCGLSSVLSKAGIPIVLSLMGSDLLGSPDENGKQIIRGRLDKLLSKYVAVKVDHIIVKSEEMKNKLKIKIPISVIPNGVDFDFFKPTDIFESRKKLGFEDDEFLVLFLGNPNEPRKNYNLSKKAVELFKNENNSGNIKLLSPFGIGSAEIVEYMNASNVLLLTSYWEGSPNVIKEAMACNLPIISVDVGDVREVIKDSFNCFIIEYDEENIVEKLKVIYQNKQRSNGRINIENLESSIIAKKIITIYRSYIK